MGRGKRTIRASEIGAFLYCRRAWWYQRQGFKPMNQEALDVGSEFHNDSAGKTQFAVILRYFAWTILGLSLIYLIWFFS
jgi:CRISPR/Cas system-associated exonuclease Cas4 (RecB family)